MVESTEVTPWESLKGINVDSMERLAKMISSTTPDGEYAFGRAGQAAGMELLQWVTHRRENTVVRVAKAKRKKEKTEADPQRLLANKVMTYCEESYRGAFNAPLSHRSNWFASSSLILKLIKSGYTEDRLRKLWDNFLECGKDLESSDNRYTYRTGNITDFKISIGRLEAMGNESSASDNIVPLSFASGG